MASRSFHVTQSLGSLLTDTIQNAKVLMVGAGGIGCELLKNLVLTGYGEIHIVDLDTIDLSNLNRQFLFGHEHIKKSKALVSRPRSNVIRRPLLTVFDTGSERIGRQIQPKSQNRSLPCKYQGSSIQYCLLQTIPSRLQRARQCGR